MRLAPILDENSIKIHDYPTLDCSNENSANFLSSIDYEFSLNQLSEDDGNITIDTCYCFLW